MSTLALWLVAGLYAAQMMVELARGNGSGATILGGYIVANLGLIWSFQR